MPYLTVQDIETIAERIVRHITGTVRSRIKR